MPKPVVTDVDRHVGARLQKLRQQEDISATMLAEAIGSTQQQISRYETGQNKLGASQLHRLSQCLGVPISWFFQDVEDDSIEVLVKNDNAKHEQALIKQELKTVQALWPRLNQVQRATVLQLLDTFLL